MKILLRKDQEQLFDSNSDSIYSSLGYNSCLMPVIFICHLGDCRLNFKSDRPYIYIYTYIQIWGILGLISSLAFWKAFTKRLFLSRWRWVGKVCSNCRLYKQVRNLGLLFSTPTQANVWMYWGCQTISKDGNKNRKAKSVPETYWFFFLKMTVFKVAWTKSLKLFYRSRLKLHLIITLAVGL